MGNYNQGKRFGGNRDRRDRPQMHHAVCADCGRDCEVPFRPSGGRDIFCSDCFGGKESSNDRFEKRSFNRSNDRPKFGDKKMFRAVCDKCHKDCEVPFKPSGDKEVFCSDCFGNTERKDGKNNTRTSDNNKKQFEALNNKLDEILRILSGKSPVKEEKSEVKKEKESKAKEEKKIVKKKEPKAKSPKKESTPKKSTKKIVAKKKKATSKKTKKKVVKKKK